MEEEILNIEEFLPLGEPEEEKTKRPTVFNKDPEFDSSFLDDPVEDPKEEEEEEESSKKKTKEATSEDDSDDSDEEDFDEIIKKTEEELEKEDEEEENKPKGLSKKFEKLFEKGVLVPFDDDKSIDDYTSKDWEELIEANITEKSKEIETKVQTEFFNSLPEELQSAAQYVMSGGRDLKSMFKVLSDATEVMDLNPEAPEDQEIILKQFLLATQFGSNDEIDEQIDSWKEAGQLEKWAKKHKPKLDRMYAGVVEQQVKAQEQLKKQQQERKEIYLDNVYQTLKKGELNGVKLDSKKQKFLWEEMTQTKYESMSGRPTNLLGHLLEKYQFGEEQRYDLITEALWLLEDPDGYKEAISKNKVKETNAKTVRTLKTEQSRKNSSSPQEEPEEKEEQLIENKKIYLQEINP